MSASLVGDQAEFPWLSGRPDEGSVATTDRELLDRFLTDRDEAAFERLVGRHGPRVLRICRRWLGDGQDAEDAYQATFLLLATRGDAIRRPGNVGGWLSGVARRVAGRAKMKATRRRRLEGTSIDLHEVADRRGPALGDDLRALRAEIERLPEKYRRPIELCYWDGLSSEQAASLLQCPTGTVKWRLSQARESLRGRLGRAGILLSTLLAWLGRPRRSDAASALVHSGRDLASSAASPAGGADASRRVKDAVDLALLLRDAPSLLGEAASRGGRSTRRFGGLAPLIVVAAAFLAASFWSLPTLARVSELLVPSQAWGTAHACGDH
ncbi:RNA polymerase sigma factor [Paludisphaera mucosa]|uniref:RNA polymerase sigma factor n=1 Tax=Paludisphaera mucosa TaxID=3030827 RepID=A0ABT6FC61_9BACT|nr:RNA polymerase sigma factor [Paludisphaera mucosa]MDG3005120.1 RNA polymerase sigma factor [Paludisphaera mucosa]